MFEDIKKSLNATLYERVTNPFVGSFFIAWCISNWRILYVSFFETTNTLNMSRIDYITSYLLTPCNLYIKPLIIAILAITILPYLSFLGSIIPEKSKILRKNYKKDLSKETLVDQQQYFKILDLLDKQMNRFVNIQNELETANRTLIETKDTLFSTEDEVRELKTTNKQLS